MANELFTLINRKVGDLLTDVNHQQSSSIKSKLATMIKIGKLHATSSLMDNNV